MKTREDGFTVNGLGMSFGRFCRLMQGIGMSFSNVEEGYRFLFIPVIDPKMNICFVLFSDQDHHSLFVVCL